MVWNMIYLQQILDKIRHKKEKYEVLCASIVLSDGETYLEVYGKDKPTVSAEELKIYGLNGHSFGVIYNNLKELPLDPKYLNLPEGTISVILFFRSSKN